MAMPKFDVSVTLRLSEFDVSDDCCPNCGSPDVIVDNTPDYGGDGERLWITSACKACGITWDDLYRIAGRRIYT